MRVVICGGGVIGATLAYFLSLRQAEVIVVERTGIACAASGKSGGFLALDWCDGSVLAPLARRSFALHAELAAEHGNPWGYRRLDTLSVAASARRRLGNAGTGGPGWLDPAAQVNRRLGTAATTAQVNPAAFTHGMMDLASARGAAVRRGRVDGLLRAGDRLTGVLVDGAALDGDAVVIAMGPWSVLAARWLPLPAVYGLKGHSVIFKSGAEVTPHALFVECEAADGAVDTPEVFPRPDGTTYVCGLSSQEALPLDPADVATDARATARLKAMTATFAPALARAEVLAAQACYRPVAHDGLPLIGPVRGLEGAFVATGHSVWGMLNAPATGEALAALIVDGASRSVDLAPFNLARLPPLE